MAIMLCFLLYLLITLEYMNWSSVVFAGVIVISGIYWVLVFRRQAPLPNEHHAGPLI